MEVILNNSIENLKDENVKSVDLTFNDDQVNEIEFVHVKIVFESGVVQCFDSIANLIFNKDDGIEKIDIL